MLRIRQLQFSYTPEQPLFEDFSFQLEKEKICTLLGQSGSGKSTLLKLIYGLYDWPHGEIELEGRKLLGPKGNLVPGEPDIKWVAQEFDLMPYTSVAENVGIYFSNINLSEKKAQIIDLLKVVDLEDFYSQKVTHLSGGQKQRVALAKALAQAPKLLLLDEPFSQMDAYLKNKLQRQLFEFVKSKKITVLMVTHNVQDALSFSDRIDILEKGQLIESQSPKEIFFNPKEKATLRLLGDINVLNLSLFGGKDEVKVIHPFELIEDANGISVEVAASYFKGSHYLVQGLFKEQSIYFYHRQHLPSASYVILNFKPHRLR